LQTPKHLILSCKHYKKEREKMKKELKTQALTLGKLFNTVKGRTALQGFLKETEIATARWLLAAGAL